MALVSSRYRHFRKSSGARNSHGIYNIWETNFGCNSDYSDKKSKRKITPSRLVITVIHAYSRNIRQIPDDSKTKCSNLDMEKIETDLTVEGATLSFYDGIKKTLL